MWVVRIQCQSSCLVFWFGLLFVSPVQSQEPCSFSPGSGQEALSAQKQSAGEMPNPTVKWTGQVQTDFIWTSQNEVNREAFGTFPDGAAFRRARFGMFGDYGLVNYRIEVDFALAGRPTFLDVFIGLQELPLLGSLRVGHFFEPFSLERTTPNRFTTFLERSLIDEAFAPARNLGVMSRDTFADERGTWAVGVFASDSDVFGDSAGRDHGWAGTGRVTFLPLFDACEPSRYLHIGAAYSLRQPLNEQVRFRARPELRIGATSPNIPFVADTGVLRADFFQLLGGEFLVVWGPLALQAEIHAVPVALVRDEHLWFWGGYVEVGLFLTGEYRRYNRRIGAVDRLIPEQDFIDPRLQTIGTGPGAIELTARVSHLDLEVGSVHGGEVTNYTLGLNWYLNRYLRLTANYVHSEVAGRGRSDGVGLRMGWDF
jgi:phosphate-selective porin OprO/OprP